jgi:D-erythronate 2-dehydrogenase
VDSTPLTPQTSYGAQKACGELLVNDYSRKGYLDGRSLRLPTIVVRPGKPNKAASGFASSIVREPLNGIDYECPVSPDSCMALMSPRRVVDAFVRMFDLEAAKLGAFRSLLLPGIRVSMAEAKQALEDARTNRKKGRVTFKVDPAIQKIVDGWPKEMRADRARALGFQADRDMAEIVQAYIEDDFRPA